MIPLLFRDFAVLKCQFGPDSRESTRGTKCINNIINPRRPVQPRVGDWEEYFSYLAYEMLHRFLFIYHCGCPGCVYKGHAHRTPHAATWANSMIAIQDALNIDPRWNFAFGVAGSTKFEMSKTGWIPTNNQLKRWHVEEVAGREDNTSPEDDEQDGCKDDEERPRCIVQ